MGDAVNISQRLQSAAQSQEILVTRNIFKLCEQKFDFKILEPIRVKGKEAPIEVFAVLGPKQERPRKSVLDQAADSEPLIGRDSEVRTIESLLEKVRAKKGQILLLSGEPGVGKSRLKQEAKKRAQATGLQWLEAKCTSLNRNTPYFLFAELVASLLELDLGADLETQRKQIRNLSEFKLEQIAESLICDALRIPTDAPPVNLSGTQKKLATFSAIKSLLVRSIERQPTMIFLEDLHWIDPVSHELLDSLLDSIASLPLLLAGGTRPDFLHNWSGKQNFHQISLMALTATQSLELVRAILHVDDIPQSLAEIIQSRTDGNPLFVAEIINSLMDSGKIFRAAGETTWTISADLQSLEIPPTLQGIISARIDRLFERDKLVLQYASVIGRKFSSRLVERASGFTPEELSDCLANLRKKELIFEVSSEKNETLSMFHHALVQEVCYQSILHKTRKVLHERVASAIEEGLDASEESVPSGSLEALAHHFVQAEVKEKAVEYLFKSARRMTDDYNNEGAIKSYRLAIKLSALSTKLLPDLYFWISEVYMRTGDFEEAEKYQRKLLDLGKSKNDLTMIAQAFRKIGQILLNRGHFDRALEHLHRSLECSIKGADFESQIRTYKVLANTWKKLNDFAKAIEMYDLGIQGARTLGNKQLIAEYLNDKATLQIELNLINEAKDNLELSIEISKEDPKLKSILVSSTLNLGVVQYFQKDLQGGLAKFRETERVASQIGDLMNKLIAKHNIGEMLCEFKQYDEALREFEESLVIATEIGNDLERVNNQLLIGYTKVKLGAHEDGRKVIEAALEEARSRKFWNYYLNGLFCLAEYFVDLGSTGDARTKIQEAFDKATELNNQSILARCRDEFEKLDHQNEKKLVSISSRKRES
jgi:predicted ATPase